MMTHSSYRKSSFSTFSLKLTWSWMVFLTAISSKTFLAARLSLTTSFSEKAIPAPATPSESSESLSASCISTSPSLKETSSEAASEPSEETFSVTSSEPSEEGKEEPSESLSASLTTSSLEKPFLAIPSEPSAAAAEGEEETFLVTS